MKRRNFIAFVGAAVAAGSVRARAQDTGRVYRIGVISQGSQKRAQFDALFDELRLLGFVAGQNLHVVPGGFNVQVEQLPTRAKEIAAAKPDVIFTVGDAASLAAMKATRTIPICGAAEDMVASGLVGSLSRPGGNVTGVSMLSLDLDGKRQDLLLEAAPNARRVAALADASQYNASTPAHLDALRREAQKRNIEFQVFSTPSPDNIASALAAATAWGADALNVLASPMLSAHRGTIFAHASAKRLPAIYQWPDMADAGGFAAYGPPLPELYRQRAHMIVKMFRGVAAADIPVEQPTRFELVLNLKTAKMIGHEIPSGLVLRADRLVE